MRKLTADYIFPVERKPLKNGILISSKSGEIIDILDADKIDYEIEAVEKYNGIICPGFINAHCHLELSNLKNKIAARTGLHEFIIKLEEHKKMDALQKDTYYELLARADDDMLNNGIVAVGDISNTDITIDIKRKSKIRYHNFVEVFGSNQVNADDIFIKAHKLYNSFFDISNSSIVAHSAYAVSEKLFYLVKKFSEENYSIISLHHQENEDENNFFKDKSGKIAERAHILNIDISSFQPTGLSPLASIAEYLPKRNNIQLVHNTISSIEDIEFGVNTFPNLWWCLCPGSNFFIEGMFPDALMFSDSNCKITIGTDSLASNNILSVFEEIKKIGRVYPEISLETLIEWATINGAEYLKIDDEFGSFAKGKRPGINLIQNIDMVNFLFRKDSTVKPI